MTKTEAETYEEDAKAQFTKEPANMKLLIVVDKLLTGFDAPPCTYLYIDKSMQDHGLFQAICRVNRLDGEDKDFGYIVDYKDLFRKVESAIAVYTSELDHPAPGPESDADRRWRLDGANKLVALLAKLHEYPDSLTTYLEHARLVVPSSLLLAREPALELKEDRALVVLGEEEGFTGPPVR